MTLHVITVFHNTSGRFSTYRAGDTVHEVISHCRELPESVEPEEVAEWLFTLLNADLEFLQQARENAGGESGFLLACTYRLLGLRSLSCKELRYLISPGFQGCMSIPVGPVGGVEGPSEGEPRPTDCHRWSGHGCPG